MSLALTVLIVLLPNLCLVLPQFLPRLFCIYARMLLWDVSGGATRLEHADAAAADRGDVNVDTDDRDSYPEKAGHAVLVQSSSGWKRIGMLCCVVQLCQANRTIRLVV